ncbi:MAG: phosphate ABC transporter substrate-binding protein [Betaproteobacteria bacterium]|nr:MAG: phosphate ABC transporter substrate-binding protein [Betaproteobacteria bacterium]
MKTLLRPLAWAALACVAGAACAQDLSSLPEYRPETKVSGVIRSWGSDHMATLMKYWQEGFRSYQPNVWFQDSLKGTASAQFGLHVNVADLALSGRELFPYEYYGIYRRSQLYPVEIAVATGSFDVRSKSTALGVFVHKDNPLSKLTMKQLDGIYGDQRTGGWQKIEWVEKGVARSANENIRTWGQLGLTGEWANQPIRVYGPPGLYPGGVSFFQTRVMGGADTWNESLQEFDDRKLMMEALGNDRYGIAYAALAYKTARVRSLALADNPEGPFVELTRMNVANRSYPLTRTAYIYFAPDRPTGDPLKVDPKIREFLRYILSRQGQQDVGREGDYLPLTPELIREQLKKLE